MSSSWSGNFSSEENFQTTVENQHLFKQTTETSHKLTALDYFRQMHQIPWIHAVTLTHSLYAELFAATTFLPGPLLKHTRSPHLLTHRLITWLMPCCHPAEIKATLHTACWTARSDGAGLIPEGVTVGINLRMLYWPATPLLELINQTQILRTGDGLGPIKGYALRWGQMEIYVAYIKGH